MSVAEEVRAELKLPLRKFYDLGNKPTKQADSELCRFVGTCVETHCNKKGIIRGRGKKSSSSRIRKSYCVDYTT